MAKTEANLEASAEFIRTVLQTNFKQTVKPEKLRAAAEKLCAALPNERKPMAKAA